jgi:hypothetical protein
VVSQQETVADGFAKNMMDYKKRQKLHCLMDGVTSGVTFGVGNFCVTY